MFKSFSSLFFINDSMENLSLKFMSLCTMVVIHLQPLTLSSPLILCYQFWILVSLIFHVLISFFTTHLIKNSIQSKNYVLPFLYVKHLFRLPTYISLFYDYQRLSFMANWVAAVFHSNYIEWVIINWKHVGQDKANKTSNNSWHVGS